MGKSPGKWIKNVFLGKKSSKSSFSKDATIERKASLAAKAVSNELSENPPVVFDRAPQTTDRGRDQTEIERSVINLPSSEAILVSGTTGADGHVTNVSNSIDSHELKRQEQAATMAQAAFRGYLARRAFWALKGIIRLQALVRGHLVRRQAVATLQCMRAIVKFQAVVRGRIVRLSDSGREVANKLGEPVDKRVDMPQVYVFIESMSRSTNPFVKKLLSSSPTAMPLCLQYDLGEPNSAWNWLERWSLSCFWVPLVQPKKILQAKPRRKQANLQTEGTEAARSKRSVRKVPAVNGDSSSLHSSEYEKPKRNPRKVLSNQPESVQEQPQSELEKVKRSLRKVSSSASAPSDKLEAVTEKLQNNQRKASGSGIIDASEQVVYHTPEKLTDTSTGLSTQIVAEAPPQSLAVDKPLDVLCESLTAVEIDPLGNSGKIENIPKISNEQVSKEDQNQNRKENQKTRRRRSYSVKQEYPESVSQNSPTLPSYMQATESAKAKLRAQESQKLCDDEAENGFTRRHSLPALTNVKLSIPSPRLQKPLQANGKGGSRSNRSLTSSGDEKSQTGWRR